MRLDASDGLRLFEAPDLLAVGALANGERERRHAGRTYFNYNIHIEATNVCVASCLFCSFARLKPGDEGAYTLSLEQAWDKLGPARTSRSPKSTSSTACIPDLPFSYYTELLRGFKRIRPGIHLKCFTAVEIAFFADLYGMTDEQVLRELMQAGLELAARRRGRGVCRTRAEEDLPRQVRRRPMARHSPHCAPARHALQRHHAVWAHRDVRGAHRSHAPRPRAAGRDRRVPGVHPARVPPRQQSDAPAAAPRARPTRCASTRSPG